MMHYPPKWSMELLLTVSLFVSVLMVILAMLGEPA